MNQTQTIGADATAKATEFDKEKQAQQAAAEQIDADNKNIKAVLNVSQVASVAEGVAAKSTNSSASEEVAQSEKSNVTAAEARGGLSSER